MEKEQGEVKEKLLFLLFFSDLTQQFVQKNNSNNVFHYVYTYAYV